MTIFVILRFRFSSFLFRRKYKHPGKRPDWALRFQNLEIKLRGQDDDARLLAGRLLDASEYSAAFSGIRAVTLPR